MKKKGLLLLAAGAVAAAIVTRKPKRKKKKTPTSKDQVVDSGIGYAQELGINVQWAISRVSGAYGWVWQAVDPEKAAELGVPLEDASGPYETEEEAAAVLEEALGLKPIPQPEPPEPPIGELEPVPPGPGPTPVGPVVPGMGLGTPKPPGPQPEPPGQLFPLELYPPSGPEAKLPILSDATGMVVSDDCSVAAVGPMFWDAVGERVEELGGEDVEDEETIMQVLAEEFFPPLEDEIHLCPGAALIYNEMTGRVRDYLGG